jgi:endonuclease III
VKEATFATRVIAWQKRHGRHDLPWQNTQDPYRIWLSEIMLQQTQVATVIPYYARFLEKFSTLRDLGRASEDEVLALWSGLGYYSRGRNLLRAAKIIAETFDGEFPRSFDEILALPGVGQSTAAAISAFAFGERRAILDGNVKRVFARHFGIAGFSGEKKVEATLGRCRKRVTEEKYRSLHARAYGFGRNNLRSIATAMRRLPGHGYMRSQTRSPHSRITLAAPEENGSRKIHDDAHDHSCRRSVVGKTPTDRRVGGHVVFSRNAKW